MTDTNDAKKIGQVLSKAKSNQLFQESHVLCAAAIQGNVQFLEEQCCDLNSEAKCLQECDKRMAFFMAVLHALTGCIGFVVGLPFLFMCFEKDTNDTNDPSNASTSSQCTNATLTLDTMQTAYYHLVVACSSAALVALNAALLACRNRVSARLQRTTAMHKLTKLTRGRVSKHLDSMIHQNSDGEFNKQFHEFFLRLLPEMLNTTACILGEVDGTKHSRYLKSMRPQRS